MRVSCNGLAGCVAITIVLTLPGLHAAAGQGSDQQETDVRPAREMIRAFMSRYSVPGMAVAVGVGEDIVWSEGFGFADVADSLAVTPQTKFRVGSTSMSLTAAGIGQLVERNKLELEATVQCYVPSFPEKRYDVTLQQLGGHLAGIRHYRGEEFYGTSHYETVLDGLAIFAGDTLEFEPGTRYAFSTYGWTVLSAAVEAVAGEDFLSFMTLSVFEALGLSNTVPDLAGSPVENRATFYEFDDTGHLVEAPFVDNSYKWAGGGFLSTVEDLARFGLAHVNPGFLEPKTIGRLWTSQRTNDGIETGYGIGWAVGADADGRRVVSHTGSSVGSRAILLIYPDQRIVIAMAANLSRLPFRDVPQAVALLFME